MGKFKNKALIPQNHITWQSLGKADNLDALQDIIPANDNEDEEFLQEYKLRNDAEKRVNDVVKIQEYGVIKQQMRPSQIFILEEARRMAR